MCLACDSADRNQELRCKQGKKQEQGGLTVVCGDMQKDNGSVWEVHGGAEKVGPSSGSKRGRRVLGV